REATHAPAADWQGTDLRGADVQSRHDVRFRHHARPLVLIGFRRRPPPARARRPTRRPPTGRAQIFLVPTSTPATTCVFDIVTVPSLWSSVRRGRGIEGPPIPLARPVPPAHRARRRAGPDARPNARPPATP